MTKEAAAQLENGNTAKLGGWVAFDAPATSVLQLRQDLALTQGFRASSEGLVSVELEVIRPMPVYLGFVGRQKGGAGEASKYIGDGTQIQLDWAKRETSLRLVGVPKCVEGC